MFMEIQCVWLFALFFNEKDENACAEGYFVHVFVNRVKMDEKIEIPEKIKKELQNNNTYKYLSGKNSNNGWVKNKDIKGQEQYNSI